MHGSKVTAFDAGGYVGAEFIKFGEFSPLHLIWWNKKQGYFVTDPGGRDFNGHQRIVSTKDIPKHAAK
jgi:hypothetical protein